MPRDLHPSEAPAVIEPDVVRVLRRAATGYRAGDPWCQGRMEDPQTGGRCLGGQIIKARKALGLPWHVGVDAINAAARHVRSSAVYWNDAEGRTAEQVIQALEDAASSYLAATGA